MFSSAPNVLSWPSLIQIPKTSHRTEDDKIFIHGVLSSLCNILFVHKRARRIKHNKGVLPGRNGCIQPNLFMPNNCTASASGFYKLVFGLFPARLKLVNVCKHQRSSTCLQAAGTSIANSNYFTYGQPDRYECRQGSGHPPNELGCTKCSVCQALVNITKAATWEEISKIKQTRTRFLFILDSI